MTCCTQSNFASNLVAGRLKRRPRHRLKLRVAKRCTCLAAAAANWRRQNCQPQAQNSILPRHAAGSHLWPIHSKRAPEVSRGYLKRLVVVVAACGTQLDTLPQTPPAAATTIVVLRVPHTRQQLSVQPELARPRDWPAGRPGAC